MAAVGLTFDCGGATLVGILEIPQRPARVGVVVVVGGPQYRVGSHRQFVLFGRALAHAGYPVLRFDCTGMGDSGGEARAYIRHYYLQRLKSRKFWARLFAGRPDIRGSLAALWDYAWRLRKATPTCEPTGPQALCGTLPERMAQGWGRFGGPVLLLLSGDDLMVQEFLNTAQGSPAWTGLLGGAHETQKVWPAANHTFSTREWRDAVATATIEWLGALPEHRSA